MLRVRSSRTMARSRARSGMLGRTKYLQNAGSKSASKTTSTSSSRKTALSEALHKKTSTKTTTATKSTTKTDTQKKNAYDAIKESIDTLQEHANKLMQSGEQSLFSQKEEVKVVASTTQSSENETEQERDKETTVIDEINGFIKSYNNVVDKIEYLDDNIDNIYLKNIKKDMSYHSKALSKIGISVLSDGKLKVQQSKLEASKSADQEEAFGKYGFVMNKTLKYLKCVGNHAEKNIEKLKNVEPKATKSNGYNRYGKSVSDYTYSSIDYQK